MNIKRILKSFSWAMNGLHTTWKEETNFRIELLVGGVFLFIAWWVGFSVLEYAITILSVGFVLASEVVNTALEDLCDKVESSYDPIIAKVKDTMAGFVLIVAITTGLAFATILLSHL